MSADSIDLDGLERKDRAELATIAQALGGKPGSRAKKADIVAMILDLAGVDTGAGAAGGSSAAEEGEPDAADGPAEDEDGEQDGASATDDGDNGDSDDGDNGDSDDGDSDDGDSSASGGASAAAAPEQHAPSERAGGRSAGGGSNDRGSTDSPQGRQGGEDDRSDGDGGSGENQEGSRRRRRRRNRDRPDDGGENNQDWGGDLVGVAGVLDLRDEGYGFLRVEGLLPSRDDVYVSVKQTRQLGLRRGDWITGASRPANRGEKNPALLRVDTVNAGPPDSARQRPRFEDLTPVFPDDRLRLERDDHPYDMTGRIIDLLSPIGKGQRGLIVSPPKAGKTTIMKTLAQCIEANHPDVELMVLLVDERPEEVTDMRRSVEGEVVASTFDRPPDEHIAVAELAIERAKRMVELGADVVVILDGITRLARAYNLAAPSGGRIGTGGLDTGALYPPKRIFGAARNIEDGGSLTILATALVDTGSKMDEVIFEEFKGTGNMELRLDRRAAEQRVWPAIDVDGSSTRHEELLFGADELQLVWKLRRVLSALATDAEPAAALEMVVDRMRRYPTNEVFLAEIAKSAPVG